MKNIKGRVEPYFAHLCNSYNWKRIIITGNSPGNIGNVVSESPISKFFWGRGDTPLALMFAPMALTSTCFTYESGTLQCYQKH